MSLLAKPATYKYYSCPFFNEWESPLITNEKIPNNEGGTMRDFSRLARGLQPAWISGASLKQLEPKCPQAAGASARHQPAFTGCWGTGAVQGCSREDPWLGSTNLLAGRKRQLVSQNLPQGVGWFVCFVFLFSRGETFSFPLGQGCHISSGSAEQQLWGSSSCKVAVLAIQRRRRNHLFRNWADSEAIAWVTSPPLNFIYWHGWSASCSWRIILHFKPELRTFKANLCWLEHFKIPVPPLLFQAVSSCSHLHFSSMEKTTLVLQIPLQTETAQPRVPASMPFSADTHQPNWQPCLPSLSSSMLLPRREHHRCCC